MKNLRIGYVAGFMDGFSKVGLETFEENRKDLEKMGKNLGFEVVHYSQPVMNIEQARNVRTDMKGREIDFLLLFQPAYIIGDFVYELMKLDVPLGLWAIEEPRDEGPMPLASFVNLCQNAGIAQAMFKDHPRRFKWFFGPLDGVLFARPFEITVRALKVVKNLRNARVAQIGKLADGHINHSVDNRDIYAKLGVDVSRDYEIEDIMSLGDKIPDSEVKKELNALNENCKRSRIGADKVELAVRHFLAVKKLAEDEEYAGIAYSCWPKLMPLLGMSGCLTNALLNNTGIPGGCEADVLGTVSMLVLKLLTEEPTVLMDLPKFDTEDNSLMLWHCGTSPFSMAGKDGVLLERHYFADYSDDPDMKDCGPTTDVIFRESPLTVFRICRDADYFYYFTGRSFDNGKKTFRGSRGWVGDLHLYKEPVAVLDLMNTIIYRAGAHHYPMVMRDVGSYLEETAYWLGLKRVSKDPYKEYLSV